MAMNLCTLTDVTSAGLWSTSICSNNLWHAPSVSATRFHDTAGVSREVLEGRPETGFSDFSVFSLDKKLPLQG